MTIETKSNIGDEVWFLNDNKVCVSFIEDVRVKINNQRTKIEYMVETVHKKNVGLQKEEDLSPPPKKNC